MGGLALTTALSWHAASLTGIRQYMPTHALTFTKHRQPMFNYYNISTFFVVVKSSKSTIFYATSKWALQVSYVVHRLSGVLPFIWQMGPT